MAKKLLNKYLSYVTRGSSNKNARSAKDNNRLIEAGRADIAKIYKQYNSFEMGLNAAEAERRLEKYGPNVVAQQKPTPWYVHLFRALTTPFTLILFALGIVSLFTDVIFIEPDANQDWTTFIILMIMIVVSSGIHFWQELRSQIAAEKLNDMVRNQATVTRHWNEDDNDTEYDKFPAQEGTQRDIPMEDIVPGDIINLSSGDMVPADVRLMSSKDLFVSQSALTGESMPLEKYADISEVSDQTEDTEALTAINPLEMGTLCFMGTNVISGSAKAIVIATGHKTYFGSMAASIAADKSQTSFDRGVNRVSWLLIKFMLVMVPLVFIINGLTKGNWADALFFSLAVAVGLTPEMLPMIVTTNLAKGSVKMSRKKVIVKKLNSIQNFGAMDILCTDKTGTITEDRVVLTRYLDISGQSSTHVLEMAYINSYFQTGLKNLMDRAIIDKQLEVDSQTEVHDYQKIDEIPFDFSRRRMSVIVRQQDGQDVLVCKGAVEEIIKHCTHVEVAGKTVQLTDKIISEVNELTQQLNRDGLRVLAVAHKYTDQSQNFYEVSDEEGLVLAGYVGFLDPPKESAGVAISLLQEHGVDVKIITGDNELVASRVSQDVGLIINQIMLGSQVDELTDEELAEQAKSVTIFAKTDPLQKARIVEALKSGGHVVGFMGDGINDAAAMRQADVSISVDTAVDIAKEAADIILLENDLMVLERGIMEGRTVFGNIMKYIKITASSNFGNMFSVLVASAVLPFLPMLAIQILVLNLLYDLSQMTIPWDKMDEEFLEKPRKWGAANIARFMIFIGPISSIFDILTFALMWFVFSANTVADQSLFQTGWFIVSLITQTMVVYMLRTQKAPFLQSNAAKPVFISTILAIIVGLILPYTIFGSEIGLAHLPVMFYPYLIAIVLAYSTVTQFVKTWYINKFSDWL